MQFSRSYLFIIIIFIKDSRGNTWLREMGRWALKLNDEQFIIEYLNCMESDYDSKGSIDSIATKYIGLSLKTEP